MILKENAHPHAVHTPIHLREQVSKLLKSEVRNKIIRKCEDGEANEWCASMLPVLKKDGSIRRTVVDHQKLNEQCDRETYHQKLTKLYSTLTVDIIRYSLMMKVSN